MDGTEEIEGSEDMLAGNKLSDLAPHLLVLGVSLVFLAFYLVLSISQSEWRLAELNTTGFLALLITVYLYLRVKASNKEWMEARDRLMVYITSRFRESGISADDILVEKISLGIWEGSFLLHGERTVIVLRHGEILQSTKWTRDDPRWQ